MCTILDDGGLDGDREVAAAPGPSGQAKLLVGLLSIFLVVFVAGGLYFGYIFVRTAVSLLTGDPGPAGASLLPGNPFQSASRSPAPVETVAPLPDWHGNERLNVLLLGLDQRDAERGQPTRSDTMIVVTIDPVSKTAAMLAIPRDLWVVIPGHGENKINTAHFFGELERRGGGPELAKRTVESAFGIRIHYYARVDFVGFEKLVDAIGGITIDAPKPIKDDAYPAGDWGVRRVYIPVGPQHLDGQGALQYARSRHSDNDLGRGQRQLQVLLAAKSQAMRLDLLPKLPLLLGVLRGAVSMDVPAADVLGLANLGRQIDTKSVTMRAIDWTMMTDVYGDGTILVPKWDQIRPMVAELFADPRFKAEHATLIVQNGTLRDGLGATVGEALRRRGYDVQNISQATQSDYRETLIFDHSGKKYTIERLADLLGVPSRNIRSSSGGNSDITVVLGADARVP